MYLFSIPGTQRQIKIINENLVQITNEIYKETDTINELQLRRQQTSDQMNQSKRMLGSLQDKTQLFRRKIASQQDVLRAMDWLEENRAKLRGECYGPLGLHVDVSYDAISTT